MANKTFKSIVHALRLLGINIPKNALLPSQLPALVSSSEEEDMDGIEEEDILCGFHVAFHMLRLLDDIPDIKKAAVSR
jgi:hypothetical protein